jgi:DNA-binding NtrC family response regulator/tetratricopeptide (TPR) repeat protein
MKDEKTGPAHPDPVACAAELSVRARADKDLPDAGGHAFRALQDLVGELRRRVPDPSRRLQILALFLDTCRIVGRVGSVNGALPHLEELLDPRVEASDEAKAAAAASLAGTLIQWGRYDEALRWCRRVDSDRLGSCTSQTQARLISAMVQSNIRLGKMDSAQALVTRFLLVAEQGGDPALQGTVWGLMANLSKMRGSLRESNRLYLQAARFHRLGADHVGEIREQLNRGWLLNRMGLLEESAEAFAEVRRLAANLGHARLLLLARLGQAQILLRQGHAEEARADLLSLIRDARKHSMPRERCLALGYLGECHILSERLRLAATSLELSRRAAEHLAPDGDLLPESQIRSALLALAKGECSRAHDIARESARISHDLGLPWEEARGLRIAGTALVLQGEWDPARQVLEQAGELFARMDEQLDIQLVRAWLQWLENRAPAAGSPPAIQLDLDPRGAGDSAPGIHAVRRLGLPLHVFELPGRSEDFRESTLRPGAQLAEVPADGIQEAQKIGPRSRDHRPGKRSLVAAGSAPPGVDPTWSDLGLVTRSPRLLRILQEVEHLSRHETNILLLGETGTGKELLAHGIHQLSGSKGLFVPFNCAGYPEGLIESELFGAERGAFTGAERRRDGLIAKASGGTLFLDEIGDLRPEVQGSLLRFLDKGEVLALGSSEVKTFAVRVLAATNRPLRWEAAQRRFRQDLYYRLSQASIELPPLRARLEDLDLLIQHLWPRLSAERPVPEFLLSPAGLQVLAGNGWPGNVRQLRQLLQRIVVLLELGERLGPARVAELLTELAVEEPSTGLMGIHSHAPGGPYLGETGAGPGDQSEGLRPRLPGTPPGEVPRTSRKRARVLPSRDEVRRVIEACGGDRTEAANALGISRASLYRLLRAPHG